MPIRFWIEKEKRRVRLVMSGVVSLEDALSTINAAVVDPSYSPGFDLLSDHAAVDEPLTPDATKQMLARLEQVAHVLRGARWAAVATSPAPYGMLRMLSVHIEPLLELQVFRTMADAERWLDQTRQPG